MSAQTKGTLRLQPDSPDNEIAVPSTDKSQTRKQEARKNLERFIDQLAVMAHCREQLKAELNDVYVLLDSERFDSLTRRIRLFREVVDALCDMLGRRK
jgi:hypothetical protein